MTEGDLIKSARKAAHLTQKELAKKSGLAVVTIQQYERNLRRPRLDSIIKIANALNIPPETLFSTISIGVMTEYDIEKLDYLNPGIFSDGNLKRITELFELLNCKGQDKAIDQVELLTQIPAYRKQPADTSPDDVLAAHEMNPTEEEKNHADEIMKDDSEWE